MQSPDGVCVADRGIHESACLAFHGMADGALLLGRSSGKLRGRRLEKKLVMSKRVRVGLVGSQFVSSIHADSLKPCADAELVAVASLLWLHGGVTCLCDREATAGLNIP